MRGRRKEEGVTGEGQVGRERREGRHSALILEGQGGNPPKKKYRARVYFCPSEF